MTSSKDEMEIESTHFETEDSVDYLTLIRDADQKAVNIAKTIIQLKEDLNNLRTNCEVTKLSELEVCRVQEKLTEKIIEYETTIAEVLKLTKIINFSIEDLECQKIDTSELTKLNNCMAKGVKSCDGEQMIPWILINNERKYPTFFHNDPNSNITKLNENDNESICCSCNDSSENCCESDCEDDHTMSDECHKCSEKSDTDCKKEEIRDELMAIKGGIKILNQQNRDFLINLNTANQQTQVLTNSLKNKLALNTLKGDDSCLAENNKPKSNSQVLIIEINRLNDELKELKRDRCQIELAKKVLNISESPCANCAGSINICDAKEPKSKEQTAEYNELLEDHNKKLLEIVVLRNMLDEAQCHYKNYEEHITILKTQVCQLQKQLFDFNSAKSHDPELVCSNEKYLIQSLRNRLQEATEEKTSMQMVLDFHLTELEDKKTKFLAVLQTNQEQKFRIENICKERNTIAEEYEKEFNRMNEHLKSCLEELGTLPGLLAAAQRDLEIEKSARIELESEQANFLNEIESLKSSLANCDKEKNEERIRYLEEENTHLKAEMMTIDATLEENKRLYMERTHYSLQLKESLDIVRKEAALQVTKTKNFAACQMLKYNEYIRQLEQKLVENRAVACLEFQKRDQTDERLRNQIEVLTKSLDEAQKQMKYIINAKEAMEDKIGEEICKIPRVLNSACKDLNTLKKHPDTQNDNNSNSN